MLKAKIPLSLKSFLKFNTCILNYDDLIKFELAKFASHFYYNSENSFRNPCQETLFYHKDHFSYVHIRSTHTINSISIAENRNLCDIFMGYKIEKYSISVVFLQTFTKSFRATIVYKIYEPHTVNLKIDSFLEKFILQKLIFTEK